MIISLIVAASKNNVIGKNGKIPWNISEDLKRFKQLTWGHHIIMGRKTFESIGKPLEGRTSVVLSQNSEYKIKKEPSTSKQALLENTTRCKILSSLSKAIQYCDNKSEDEAFIIGGESIFQEAVSRQIIDRVYLTRIHKEYDGDTYFPDFDKSEYLIANQEDHQDYSFIDYIKNNLEGKIIYFIHEEELYAGKIIQKVKDDIFQIRTYFDKETLIELPVKEIYFSFKRADNDLQKLFPDKEPDFDALMDTVRFLQF